MWSLHCPHLTPKGHGLSRRQGASAGPCAGRSVPELDWEAASRGPPAALQAAAWQLEVARAARAATEHLLGRQELARQAALRKVLEQVPAQCRSGAAGAAEHPPPLSLATEVVKEGLEKRTEKSCPASAPRLLRAWMYEQRFSYSLSLRVQEGTTLGFSVVLGTLACSPVECQVGPVLGQVLGLTLGPTHRDHSAVSASHSHRTSWSLIACYAVGESRWLTQRRTKAAP